MRFFNNYLEKIYKYIYIHSGQTILVKDIVTETGFSKPTVIKYIKWLEYRDIIKKTGKLFSVVPV